MAGAAASIPMFATLVTAAIVWTAAWVDLRTGRIPNAVSVAGAGIGLLIFLEAEGVSGLIQGLSGLGLGLLLMLPGHLLRSTGAGDVKLMAAVGALLGPERVVLAFVIAILSGAVIAAGYAIATWWTKGARGPWGRYARMLRVLLGTGRFDYRPPDQDEALNQRFAFGPPIAIGSTVAAIWPLV